MAQSKRLYVTRDQHVRLHGKYIEPYTIVEAPPEDWPIWEQLVESKVADRPGPNNALEIPVAPGSETAAESRELLEALTEAERRWVEKFEAPVDGS